MLQVEQESADEALVRAAATRRIGASMTGHLARRQVAVLAEAAERELMALEQADRVARAREKARQKARKTELELAKEEAEEARRIARLSKAWGEGDEEDRNKIDWVETPVSPEHRRWTPSSPLGSPLSPTMREQRRAEMAQGEAAVEDLDTERQRSVEFALMDQIETERKRKAAEAYAEKQAAKISASLPVPSEWELKQVEDERKRVEEERKFMEAKLP